MKLTELQQLNMGELKELAAKEGVVPSGDKRSRITWLVALEQHFEEKKILNYQPKYHQLKKTDKGEIFYRRRGHGETWQKSNLSWLQQHRRCIELEQLIDQTRMLRAVDQFRSACVPIAASPRPP